MLDQQDERTLNDHYDQCDQRTNRVLPRLAYMVSLFVVLLHGGCERYALDRQMDELCKKDGGIKVYETVTLPAEMFDQNGDPFPGWRKRPAQERLGSDYRLDEQTTYIKKGDPLKGQGELVRFDSKVIRNADGKVLGQQTSYGRSGGDLIVVDHPSSKLCPQQLGSPTFVIRTVFVKQGN